MDKLIPFNKPYVPAASKSYAIEALESDHQQGDGPFTARAAKMISDLVGGGHVLLTPSCTHALEMASMLGNFGPGDEVILPSYTFTSAVTAITKFGATPVFVDIDPVTKGIDSNQVAEAVTDKTVAISWVNYAGVAPDIEALQSVARKYDLLLIEDNAHGLGGTYKGKPLGSFGDFATQSFHATKNIQCGEGGALVINSPKFIERAEIIREKGTDRSKFVRGEVQKYQWVDQGSSYLLSETLAAILLGQLEEFEKIQEKRENLWNYYRNKLQHLPHEHFIANEVNKNSKNIAHMFYLELVNSAERQILMESFMKKGITLTSHYAPLHNSIMGKKLNTGKQNCENSINVGNKICRLPLFYTMDYEMIEEILDKIEHNSRNNPV